MLRAMVKDKKYAYGVILPALLLSFLLYFWNLGGLPIQIYDESRYVNQAIEMSQSGNIWIPTHKFTPDHYATKPPLGIWMMALCSSVFGETEFGFRVPSALSAWLCGMILAVFCVKRKKLWAAFLVPVLLSTLPGFLEIHAARTADLDAPLALFTTWFLVEWLEILADKRISNWNFLRMGLALMGALWVKGIAVFLLGPGFVVAGLCYYPSFMKILKQSAIYVSVVLPLISIVIYYFGRNSLDVDFLQSVVEGELMRSSNAIDGHVGEWWFYLNLWANYQWVPYLLLVSLFLFIEIGIGIKVSRLIRSVFLFSISFIIILSLMETKVAWYDVPLYPILALFIALVFQEFLVKISNGNSGLQLVIGSVMVLTMGFGFKRAMTKVNLSRNYQWPFTDYREDVYYHPKFALDSVMKGSIKGCEPVAVFPFENGYDDHLRFYVNQYKAKGHKVDLWWDNSRYWEYKTLLIAGELIPFFKQKGIPIKDTLAVYNNVYLLVPGEKPDSIPANSFINP